jgi:molybdopterin synthase sulfur carrier subunit
VANQVTVRYWAGARRAAGLKSEELAADTLSELIAILDQRPELSDVLRASTFLVDNVAGQPESPLPPGAIVDVLPPFAGG